ncbi:right-handed parallel beta-helix repeat-containing protein [Paenibacillus hodogayensis]|uniref:Right-handed parallel beta-helix repeat-containing protein n=1 Tax=Paenibacillus hodogayensis TaxID=279208 RepID=A0ABV5W7U1_9BACL
MTDSHKLENGIKGMEREQMEQKALLEGEAGAGLTRRKLLAAIGATGLSVAAGGAFMQLLTPGAAAAAGVTSSVYGISPSLAGTADPGWVNVLDYGAVGDGTTDDTAAFQAAAVTGKPVLVPAAASYYKLTASVSLTNSIFGVGMPEIRMDGANGSLAKRMFMIVGYQGGGLTVSGLYLNGGYSSGTLGEWSHHIYISHSQNVYVHNNWLHAPYGDCVYIGSDYVAPSENVQVRENVLSNPRRCAVAVVSGRKVWIERNVVRDPYPYVSAIDLEPNTSTTGSDIVEDVWIEDNEFYSEIYFVNSYNPNPAYPNKRITIAGNKGKASYLFRCSTTAGTAENVTIRDNEFYGAGRMITSSNVLKGLEISGNRDYSTGPSGWNVANATTPVIAGNLFDAARAVAVTFQNCQSIRFADNLVKNPASSDGAVRFAGTTATSRHQIVDNQILGGTNGGYFFGAVVTDSLFDGNVTECAVKCILVDAAASGSDLRITTDNVFTGAGVAVSGGANLTRWTSPDIQAKGTLTGWAAAVPTAGAWKRGSLLWNVQPSSLSPVGWVCVTDGTPGMWLPLGSAGGLTNQALKLASPGGTVYIVGVSDSGALTVSPA